MYDWDRCQSLGGEQEHASEDCVPLQDQNEGLYCENMFIKPPGDKGINLRRLPWNFVTLIVGLNNVYTSIILPIVLCTLWIKQILHVRLAEEYVMPDVVTAALTRLSVLHTIHPPNSPIKWSPNYYMEAITLGPSRSLSLKAWALPSGKKITNNFENNIFEISYFPPEHDKSDLNEKFMACSENVSHIFFSWPRPLSSKKSVKFWHFQIKKQVRKAARRFSQNFYNEVYDLIQRYKREKGIVHCSCLKRWGNGGHYE